jgi:transposase
MRRTAVVNQIRSLLLERGLTLPKGRSYVDRQLPRILEDGELRLSGSFRVLLAQLKLELEQLSARIEEMDRVIQKTAKENEDRQRLTEIPGIGPVTATALIAAVGNASAFQKGRNLAAWMGIVPGEYSTGGKQKLLGISKRGNKYLRTLFIQGARSVVQQRHKQSPGLSHWLAQLLCEVRSLARTVPYPTPRFVAICRRLCPCALLKYVKAHSPGDSTTPSSEMNNPAAIFLI